MNWFKHDYTASEDDKILELRSKYGWEGYGLFYAILEYMCKTEKGIDRKRIGALRMMLNTDQGYLEGYLEYTLEVGLFYLDGDIIYNQRIRQHIDLINQRRQEGSIAGKKSAEIRRQKTANPSDMKVTLDEPSRVPATDKIREDKIREDNMRVDNTLTHTRDYLVLPKADNDPELIQFFTDAGGNAQQASMFFNHYHSQNWVKSNGMAVTNWKAMARKWIDRDNFGGSTYKSKPKSIGEIMSGYNL